MVQRTHTDTVEGLVLFHWGVLTLLTTWGYGGQVAWARELITDWGVLGIILMFLTRRFREDQVEGNRLMKALWPLAFYNLLVVAGCLNPNFQNVVVGGNLMMKLIPTAWWLPSAARPELALRELVQFDALVLSSCNLALVLRSRRITRAALLFAGLNAVALAMIGSVQKLAGAPGLWFGQVPSPNPYFFATFVYHNHWGSYAMLTLAIWLGLLFHYGRRREEGRISSSLVPVCGAAIVVLVIALPLSASRSTTVLGGALLCAAAGHALRRAFRRREGESGFWMKPGAVALGLALTIGLAAYFGQEVIRGRLALTREQLAEVAKEDTLNARLTLYRDTWRMAMAKPLFGWGLESYGHVFRLFNSQRSVENLPWRPLYLEAHNDWLQSLAETGFAGTGLLGLLLWQLARTVRWRNVRSLLPRYLLLGCTALLLYAWVEFPFANPAVMLTFWTVWFCALRYAALSASERGGKEGA